jgi:uracil-DNA glycosylase family 4
MQRSLFGSEDNCNRCGMSKGIESPCMEMSGLGKLGIFIAGQSPGKEEDKQGKQFRGTSGREIRTAVERVGFNFDRDFYVQNAFRCHPKIKKANWQMEVKNCHPLFMKDIRAVCPWLVVACGKEAIQAALGDFYNLAVAQYQSLLIPMVEDNYWVYCTNHPAALIYGGRGKSKYEWVFRYDWEQVKRLNEERPALASEMKKHWEMDNYRVVNNFDEALAELKGLYHRNFYRDYENYPLKPYNRDSEVLCFSAAYKTRGGIRVFSVPWKAGYWSFKQRQKLLGVYKQALENPNTTKMAHHHKHELQWDNFLGIDTKGHLECTQIRQHLLREAAKTTGLKFQVFVRWGCRYDDALEPFKTDMRKAPEPDIYIYNCHDSRFGLKLWMEQEKEKYQGFETPYEVIMMPGDRTLTRMEITGAAVDLELAREIGDGFEVDGKELIEWLLNHEWAKKWEEINGYKINLNSGQQIGELLFDIVKLPGGIRTETQWSTNKNDLALLAKEHQWIRSWQKAGKLKRFKGTFVDGHIFSNLYDDGRLHGSYNYTRSHRSRMRDPNLQNMVKRDERGKTLRRAFIPLEPGWEILSVDYSQHEVVTYCHNTQDEVMIQAILEEHDFHNEYAAKLLRKVESVITEDERAEAGKGGFIFPILYGAYPKKISEGLRKNGYSVPYNHVVKTWQQFRKVFWRTIDWQEEQLEFYNKHGYIENKLKFRRRAPLAVNEIINTPNQSLAFNYLMYGLSRADERMLEEDLQARPVKQIHDEAEFHYPKHERERVLEIVKDCFEELPWSWTKTPPVKIDGKIGPNWYDQKGITF